MSSSVGMQMPGLYLRGALKNTMRDVDPATKAEIEEIINLVSDDPNLQACKIQFKNALKYTIGSDYKSDSDTAEQEFLIAVWRAAVAAKCGWGEHQASQQTITDKIQRKKFFQTWVFNYLRQILLENRPAIQKTEVYENVSTFENAKNEIVQSLNGNQKIIKEYSYGQCELTVNTDLLSSLTIGQINSLSEFYTNKNIDISIFRDKILIASTFEILKKDLVALLNPVVKYNSSSKFDINTDLNAQPSEIIDKLNELLNKYFTKLDVKVTHESISIDNSEHALIPKKTIKSSRVVTKSVHKDENNESCIPEIACMNPEEFRDPDTINSFYNNLSDDAKKIVDVIMNQPDEYEKKYKTKKPVQKYISEYLGFDLNYTKQLYTEMRIKYVTLIGHSKD
ncbi:hypothetical protein CCP1ISM_20008 [Azospirillaceae bacterium]